MLVVVRKFTMPLTVFRKLLFISPPRNHAEHGEKHVSAVDGDATWMPRRSAFGTDDPKFISVSHRTLLMLFLTLSLVSDVRQYIQLRISKHGVLPPIFFNNYSRVIW